MVEIAIASLPHIKATLNYVAATGEKLVSYAYEPPAGVPISNVQVEGHATTIHDLRPAASEFALDAVGFKLLTHRSAVKDFWDEEEIKRVYYPESVELLKRVTGATEVRVFDHTLRRRVPGKTIVRPASRASPPVLFMSIRRRHPAQIAFGSPILTKLTNCSVGESPSSIFGGRSPRRSWTRRLQCATRAA